LFTVSKKLDTETKEDARSIVIDILCNIADVETLIEAVANNNKELGADVLRFVRSDVNRILTTNY
jgi:hypothetical protein